MEIRDHELILTLDEAQEVAEGFVTGFFEARRKGYPGKAGLSLEVLKDLMGDPDTRGSDWVAIRRPDLDEHNFRIYTWANIISLLDPEVPPPPPHPAGSKLPSGARDAIWRPRDIDPQPGCPRMLLEAPSPRRERPEGAWTRRGEGPWGNDVGGWSNYARGCERVSRPGRDHVGRRGLSRDVPRCGQLVTMTGFAARGHSTSTCSRFVGDASASPPMIVPFGSFTVAVMV